MNVILFGVQQPASGDQPEAPPASCPVLEFLQGKPVEFTPELARQLLEEFTAQEQFRLRLRDSMRGMVKTLLGQASALQGELQVPYRESEQYDAGYRAGRYAQATEGAQLAQNVLNAALEMIAE